MTNYRDSRRKNHLNAFEEQPDLVVGKTNAAAGKNEDVEFSIEQADADDLEALERARQADERAERP
ncbi:MAG: YfhD family protein [Paenibacillus dendritiformis]|uniref:YfhD family protein n=1 Tax=Paenibacillus dendritiformis TaxID=130049 RepID=UPI00143DEE70|nr:YfhD family protein [Paenibacillus dendritiformis]MDU5141440.1 YfhD family protein [Paenibacillus dendritiformis]NKI21134.1 YfhD family protein [Paenibacillus dendritiformis]NRF96695.1 YfhD family protein [Paenibacillus dendritiformis]GIO72317.1 hypothetical protein J27TS7_18310 [Paenibacillus dendritiformis]